MERSHTPRHQILLLILAATAPYLISLRNQFALDDLTHIVQAPQIRSWDGVWNSFFTSLFPGNLYRPVVTISYTVTYGLFGLYPLPYHLLNLLLHAAVVVLAFKLLRKVVTQRRAYAAALVFATHPLHSEVVANVSGRAELLSAFFLLLTLLCLSKPWRANSAACVFVSFLLALLAKESAFCLLLLAPLLLFFAREERPAFCVRALWHTAALAGAAATYVVLRWNALGSLFGPAGTIDFLDNPLVNLPATERILNASVRLGHYLFLCFVPRPLSADYSFAKLTPLAGGLDAQSLLLLLLLGAVAALFILGLQRRSDLGFFAGWFLCGFAVTANVAFPIGTIFAERLAYLPSLGAAGIIAELFIRINSGSLRTVLISTTLLVYTLLGFERSRDWYDNISLFSRELELSPQSAKAQLNYGVLLRLAGRVEEAEAHMQHALKIYPPFADAAYNIGLNRLSRGDQSAALEWFEKALKMNPQHKPALTALGR